MEEIIIILTGPFRQGVSGLYCRAPFARCRAACSGTEHVKTLYRVEDSSCPTNRKWRKGCVELGGRKKEAELTF